MQAQRLPTDRIRAFTAEWPEPVRRLAGACRKILLELAPGLDETIAFRALCYTKRGRPFGVIGGNVCMLAERAGTLRLGFLHGASLPDPQRLLHGRAKAKREIEIHSAADLRRPAVLALIRAAIAHDPSAT